MFTPEEQTVHILTDTLNFGYDYSCQKTDSHFLHCHNFYEVYFFLEGDVDYLVEGQKYKPLPNSLLLLAPHVFHGVKINSAVLTADAPCTFTRASSLPNAEAFCCPPFLPRRKIRRRKFITNTQSALDFRSILTRSNAVRTDPKRQKSSSFPSVWKLCSLRSSPCVKLIRLLRKLCPPILFPGSSGI